jgi:hypothetical protein
VAFNTARLQEHASTTVWLPQKNMRNAAPLQASRTEKNGAIVRTIRCDTLGPLPLDS